MKSHIQEQSGEHNAHEVRASWSFSYRPSRHCSPRVIPLTVLPTPHWFLSSFSLCFINHSLSQKIPRAVHCCCAFICAESLAFILVSKLEIIPGLLIYWDLKLLLYFRTRYYVLLSSEFASGQQLVCCYFRVCRWFKLMFLQNIQMVCCYS